MSQTGAPGNDDNGPPENPEPGPSGRNDEGQPETSERPTSETNGTDQPETAPSEPNDEDEPSTTSYPSIKSILVIREAQREVPKSEEKDDARSFDVVYSMDTGIYKFYKRPPRDLNDSHVSKEEAFIYMVIPPDRGYAWFILLMAFGCQAIVDGILFSIGIVLPNIAEDLSLNCKQVALVASTQIGIFFISAPIGSALINRYGFRPVAVTGAIVSSIAGLLGSFSDSLASLVFFYGFLVGPAMGMVGVCSSLIINYYFERYRAIVGGIVSSGTGVGIMLVSLLNIALVENVGWRYTFRVHVVLMVISGILSTTYREVEPTKIGHYVEYISDDSDSGQSVEIRSVNYSNYIMSVSSIYAHESSTSVKNIERRINSYHDKESKWHRCTRRLCPCCIKKPQPKLSEAKMFVISHDPLDRADIFYDGTPDYARAGTKATDKSREVLVGTTAPEKKARSINYTLSVMLPPKESTRTNPRCIPIQISDAFHALFDTQLLEMSEFLLLLAIAFMCMLGMNVPFIYATARAKIEKKYVDVLPSSIGITNIIFRVSLGLIAYKVTVHPAYLSGVGMSLGGIVTLISGFYGEDSVPFQFLFVACFGIASASYSSLRAVTHVKVLGLDKLTNAFGISTMVMGVGAFCGTYIAGMLNYLFGGLGLVFIFSGSCITIAGILMLCVPRYVEFKRQSDTKKGPKKVHFEGYGSEKKK